MIKIQKLGHVVLRVRDLERSAHFYRDILGLKEVARYQDAMVFFTIDGTNHHDLAIMAVGPKAASPSPNDTGLYHIALKIGDDVDDIRKAKQWLERKGVTITGSADHTVSKSLYIADPDGIEIELYVDADPEVWKKNKSSVASIKQLDI